MVMDWMTLLGLVGITLAISVGQWLDELREWLLGFRVPGNPFRILGHTMSSTICVGFCIGFFWQLGTAPWREVLLTAGVISIVSYTADEALALVDGAVRRFMGGRNSMPQIPLPAPAPAPRKPAPTFGERPLTEEEAHSMVDAEDEAPA